MLHGWRTPGGGLPGRRAGAWFTVEADLLNSWRPFFFSGHFALSIGVSYSFSILGIQKTIGVSVGASLDLWGPATGGTVTVSLWVISFTVAFGAPRSGTADAALGWPQFRELLRPKESTVVIQPAGELQNTLPADAVGAPEFGKVWVVRATGFAFSTQSALPVSDLRYGSAAPVAPRAGVAAATPTPTPPRPPAPQPPQPPMSGPPRPTRTAPASNGHWARSGRSCSTPSTPAAWSGAAAAPTASRPIRTTPASATFIAVQNLHAERSGAKHDYRLRGLLRCALCERAFEGHWVNQTPGYRCRHGHTSAKDPGTPRPKNTFLREDRVLAKLPPLHHVLTAAEPAAVNTGASASVARPVPPSPEEVIDHLRASALVLRYDPRTRTLETGSEHPVRITI